VANLKKADLSGAILSGAMMYRANLSGTDLSGADLSRAIMLNAAFLDGVIGLTAEQIGATWTIKVDPVPKDQAYEDWIEDMKNEDLDSD
jgi:uncharacterized protein YjbI with pentapeptide repeats